MKHLVTILTFCSVIISTTLSSAYLLPEYTISSDEMAIPAEVSLKNHDEKLAELGRGVNLDKLRRHKRNPKVKLSLKEKRSAAHYRTLIDEIEFWKYVVDLKNDLLGLNPSKFASAEADEIAKSVISTIYRLSREYRVGASPLFHNFLVNHGVREKGHCYHYVEELQKTLTSKNFHHYDIHWGEAYATTFRENNALIITSKGKPFESGIAIDAWRKGSRPYWIGVADDRFPWVEFKGSDG